MLISGLVDGPQSARTMMEIRRPGPRAGKRARSLSKSNGMPGPWSDLFAIVLTRARNRWNGIKWEGPSLLVRLVR